MNSNEQKVIKTLNYNSYLRYMDEREHFLRLYANLPMKLREEVILVFDKKGPITWNVAYFEVENSTRLGEQILKKLKEMKII